MRPGQDPGNMITLFVGDNSQHTADRALAQDPSSFLIDCSNWKKTLVRAEPFTAYTSLADLPKINRKISVLWELMHRADRIHYVPPETWNDGDGFSWTSQQTLTEYYLHLQEMQGKTVIGLDLSAPRPSRYLNLADCRSSNEPVLWISGCSISHGVGVDTDQRYGTWIGRSISRHTYYLTAPGSSLEWQADQILRSDIRENDIVVWGLTQEDRAPIIHNGRVVPWPDTTLQDVEYRLHETRYYKAITSVFQVINFCHKIGCRLILLPLNCSQKLQMDLRQQDCYFQLPYQTKFLDLGNDRIHPGPVQHQYWADFCIDIINRTGHI